MLLGGAIFESAAYAPGDAMHWVVTVLVVAAIVASGGLFVYMLAGELRRGLRAAARREVAAVIAAAHAAPGARVTAPPAGASGVNATVPRLSRIDIRGWSSNPMRARGSPAAEMAERLLLQARAAAAGPARKASSWAVLASASTACARDPRAAAAVCRLQAAVRRRRALAEAHAVAATVYFRVRDDDAGTPPVYFYLNSRTGGTAWVKPALLREPGDAAVYG